MASFSLYLVLITKIELLLIFVSLFSSLKVKIYVNKKKKKAINIKISDYKFFSKKVDEFK